MANGLCLSLEPVEASGLLRITRSRSEIVVMGFRLSLSVSISFACSRSSVSCLSSSTFVIRDLVRFLLSSTWPLTVVMFLGDADLDARCIVKDECVTGRPWRLARAAAAAAALAWMKEDWRGMFCVRGLCCAGGVKSL